MIVLCATLSASLMLRFSNMSGLQRPVASKLIYKNISTPKQPIIFSSRYVEKIAFLDVTTSLQFANYHYPDADSLAPTHIVCVCGSAVSGACVGLGWEQHRLTCSL